MASRAIDPRDKYGIKTLQVGDEIKVPGASPAQFHRQLWTMRKRNPALKERQFQVWDVFGGMMVKRTS